SAHRARRARCLLLRDVPADGRGVVRLRPAVGRDGSPCAHGGVMSDSEIHLPIPGSESKQCPWCAESIRAEAVKCRHCGSILDTTGARLLSEPWLRPREGRMVAGVCAGLAEQFGISVTIV